CSVAFFCFFFQAEDGIRDRNVTGVQTCALPISLASAITGPMATCLFHFEMNGAAVSSGMGTCGMVGPIGVYTGWLNDVAAGVKAAVTPWDWAGMILLCFVLPAVLSVLFCQIERRLGWIQEGDLKLD